MGKVDVFMVVDGKKKIPVLTYKETGTMIDEPSEYLEFLVGANKSPNTVINNAYSLSFYMSYLSELGINEDDVCNMKFVEQHAHFTDFLQWVKAGKHSKTGNIPANNTCNSYLKDVLRYYQFRVRNDENFGKLKVVQDRKIKVTNTVGLDFSRSIQVFNGYLQSEPHKRIVAKKETIKLSIDSCTNLRDKLLLLLLAETGFRISELLGVDYTKDINIDERKISVKFRDNNENSARAKRAENRTAVVSESAMELLACYMTKYRNILKNTNYLFVNLSGKNVGKPLNRGAVCTMLGRLAIKTGNKVTSHQLRRFFANDRRMAGWELLLISKALGHKKLETTEKYLRIENDEMAEASNEYFERYGNTYDITNLI